MKKKIYRSENDKVIAGVVGGLAEYFEIDSTMLRLIVAALTVLGFGSLIILYIIAIFIMPKGTNLTEK